MFSAMSLMMLWSGTLTAQQRLSPGTVGGTFGAGESSVIKPGIHNKVERVIQPWDIYYTQTFSVPTGTGIIEYSPNAIGPNSYIYSNSNITVGDITLGGNDNVVIKNYSANGYGIGWISVLNRHLKPTDGDWNTNYVENKPEIRYNDPKNVVSEYRSDPKFDIIHDASLTDYSFNKFNIDNYAPVNWFKPGAPGPYDSYNSANVPFAYAGICGQAVFLIKGIADVPSAEMPGMWGLTMTLSQHNTLTYMGQNSDKVPSMPITSFPIALPLSSYTSTIDSQFVQSYLPGYFNEYVNIGKIDNDLYTRVNLSVDDDIPLVQFNGLYMMDGKALSTQKKLVSDAGTPEGTLNVGAPFNYYYSNSDEGKLANYKRPTTLILAKSDNPAYPGHEFTRINLADIGWHYEYYKVDTISGDGVFLGSCNAGTAMGYEIKVKWIQNFFEGATNVDGAVMLEPDAIVYVGNDVADATATPASKVTFGTTAPDVKTEALLVLPDSVDGRFTFRTAGNYNKLNMTHDTTTYNGIKTKNNSYDGRFYKQATFPEASNDIYLGYTGNNYTYAASGLSGFNNGGDIKIAAPATSGNGSVFGVFGSYYYKNDGTNTFNATVHTAWGDPSKAAITKYDSPGVIEIGNGLSDKDGNTFVHTDSVGYKNFHIYSGGTVKNFESMEWVEHPYPANNFAMNFTTVNNTPIFHLDGQAPLYILNYGSNEKVNGVPANNQLLHIADINWEAPGILKLTDAITNSTDSGALHIQAAGDIHFIDPLSINIPNATAPTMITMIAGGHLHYNSPLNYVNNSDTDYVAVANGLIFGNRSCETNIQSGSGEILFNEQTSFTQNGKGITLLRSENDDIFINEEFNYTNAFITNPVKRDSAGEFIMQAGQDIYRIKGPTTFGLNGQKSILLEAKKTIHFASQADALTVTKLGGTTDSITFKAGYPNFSTSAVVANWTLPNSCLIANNYLQRTPCQSQDGGDIWLESPTKINLSAIQLDTVATTLRALNSIFLDNSFEYLRTGSGDASGKGKTGTGPTFLFAETGNIEAITKGQKTAIDFKLGATDSSSLTIQAGNQPGAINAGPSLFSCWKLNGRPESEYDGNILINKSLTVTNNGTGNLTVSAARDIETQIYAPIIFTFEEGPNGAGGVYGNPGDILLTAGRHMETHAQVLIDYPNLNDTANITMQAGRLDTTYYTGSDALCKREELGTTLAKAVNTPVDPEWGISQTSRADNFFAAGGKGNGSILAFDSIKVNYKGMGTILMTALNGNIESDPYLHRNDITGTNINKGYDAVGGVHNAPIVINHEGTGLTRMEAIDIKLHDQIFYNGKSNNNKNGFVEIAAFDSILTRSLFYTNLHDAGSITITTDKLKRDKNRSIIACGEYNATLADGPRGINHGNIVLGYGADCAMGANVNDSIYFNFAGNTNKTGANVIIRAGYDGFTYNPTTGKANTALFASRPKDKGKGYGGNITFDYIKADMADGNHTAGGYMEIRTPNGNIWGKDSLSFNALDGDLYVDAGLGSLEDIKRQVRWTGFSTTNGNGNEPTLNTDVPLNCDPGSEWRTGNIMMKGANLRFKEGVGNATFRTREGFIDTYDAFNANGMKGQLLKYAGMDDLDKGRENNWGDVSERDFQYTPVATNSGSVFFGADDNIMMNYGNSNSYYQNYGNAANNIPGYPGRYNINGLYQTNNPFYHTSYEGYIDNLCAAVYNVNTDGYMWYRGRMASNLHRMYRGGNGSGASGSCATSFNGARDLLFDFGVQSTGGAAFVASNYIDMFTKFLYFGGNGSGLHSVSGLQGGGALHGESVRGFGLFIKSQFNGIGDNYPESRRAVCEDCGIPTNFPMGKDKGQDATLNTPEWTYVGFHDDARILTHNQKSWIEAPVIEFFGHAEMNTVTRKGNNTNITLKGDSLVFHDSMIIDGQLIDLLPFTTDANRRANDMRYGVINDKGSSLNNYSSYGPAIWMEDRGMPVLELGYQRCNEPRQSPHQAPNTRSLRKDEPTPTVGGDIIVAFKHGYKAPMFNTVVANHARITFITDSFDHVQGGEYVDAFIRTDLLRIRNKVQFYYDPSSPLTRSGKILLSTLAQMDEAMVDPGMYMRHLHMEPGSELSIPGEDSLIIIASTVVGGYGHIHENVRAKVNGIIAPGFASLMEGDCQTPYNQGKLSIHNLQMEKDSELRISMSKRNSCYDEDGVAYSCTQTDTLSVNDTVFFTDGQVKLAVLPETESVEPGCYLFMEYGDTLGPSKEYVKNMILKTDRYGDYYFVLYYGEIGKVYLCVSTMAMPQVQRRITIEETAGVITKPVMGLDHYVTSSQYFRFYIWFNGDPMVVTATGFYSHQVKELTGKLMTDGSYMYTITNVVEPWDVKIGPGFVANDGVSGSKIWAYKNTLYINTNREDIVSIYNVTGVMYKKLDIPEGYSSMTLNSGAYVVTLKDGTVYKVIIP